MTLSTFTLIKKTSLLVAILLFIVPVSASKLDEQIKDIVSTRDDYYSINSSNDPNRTTPDSFVELDFSISTAESWDSYNRPKNTVTNCINGDSITGFEYTNVKLTTVGTSFLSEAVIYFSNSANGTDGVRLTLGAGNENSGTAFFSSNGIIDLTDSGNVDIVSLQDNIFNIQFYEKIDDISDQVDARFTSGTLKVHGTNLSEVEGCPFINGKGGATTDISIQYSGDSPSSFQLGDTLNFEFTITNGNTIANNVSVTNTLSPQLDFVGATCDDGTVLNDLAEFNNFAVEDLFPNAVLTCSLNTTISGAGFIENTVFVDASNESNYNNNTATINLQGAMVVVPISYAALSILLLLLWLIATRSLYQQATRPR